MSWPDFWGFESWTMVKKTKHKQIKVRIKIKAKVQKHGKIECD